MIGAKRVLALALPLLGCAPLHAASLQVQPALVDVVGAASTLTLRNVGPKAIDVQIRAYRWSQTNGEEHLDPTGDVVASPPAVTLAPNSDYVARVVRVARRPIDGEEAYRLLVDELPDTSLSGGTTVRLLVRQSIPVFFAVPERRAAAVEWSIVRRSDRVILSAQNNGD